MRPRKKIGRKIFALIIVLILLVILIKREEVVVTNLWLFDSSLQGYSQKEALELIEARIAKIEEGPMVFAAGAMTYELASRELALDYDLEEIKEILANHLGKRFKYRPSFLRKSQLVMASPVYSMGAKGANLENLARRVANNLSKEPLRERYGFQGHDLIVLAAANGQKVYPEDVLKALERPVDTIIVVDYEEIEVMDSKKLEPLVAIGSFQTEYDLEEIDRNTNMAQAAKALHGTFIKAGELMSFNRVVGERSLARGYVYADVLIGNQHVPGVGGGICQVVTTLFNAAAKAGLDLVEHRAHSIPSDYVEPGYDATVAWDYLDLKVRNASDSLQIIGAWVEDGLVTVKIYGQPDGKEYELEAIVLAEYPEEGMNPGLLVETYRLIKSEGRLIEREYLRKSSYKASYPED